ncbi:hypothetical protein THAOC_18778 [Thalassiosira oceanica]|uniref:B30.2/SPRY domain-containing protein n=1 Tax=Thalassiosira oceanica TaxID=159749 RepID=K0SIG6_THAOC|nr:hypothetical protein THAOC_18778 [Thalassiosira oceanica]|eukprot:EJK60811.1 hypothetical protein THAOC_18778 [Thalassiosira oceanica]
MADDRRAKRLKQSEDVTAIIVQRERKIAELESEIAQLHSGTLAANQEVAQLRGRIAELESENERLRRHGRREECSHEVLPVVTEVIVATAVDLSRVDTSIVAQISSFLGTARELLNLALTCKSFGRPTPSTALNWSLVEEVARHALCSRASDDEMGSLPPYVIGSMTWLSILHRFDHPLLFDVLFGGYIEHRNGVKNTVRATGESYESDSVAVSGSYVMSSGAHYVEFLITGTPYIGIVRPMPGLDAGAYQGDFQWFNVGLFPDFLAQRSDDWGNSEVHACEYDCENGKMSFTDWDDDQFDIEWEGMESCQSGDTLGMLLDLEQGTLTVYKNNRRLGVMKTELSGPYCWYASLVNRLSVADAVSIKRGTLPDSDGATTN